MKIGFDFRMGGSRHAGIGRYAFELLVKILKIDNENSYFVFYNSNEIDQADLKVLEGYSNVSLVKTKIRHYSFSEQFLLPAILKKYNLDLVHFPNFNVPIFYKGTFVVTIHDVVHHKISGQKRSRYWKFLAYKKIIEHAAKASKHILTVSEASKQDIVKTFGVAENKVTVTYEAAEIKPVEQSVVEKVKKTYLLNRPYFIFVGTLERKKNIVQLAMAFDLFLKKYKLDMDLVFAGKVDQHYPDIKFQALNIQNPNNILFTGYISDSTLSALYQGAYAYVNASLNEGFGLPGVEAMKFGLPLAVSNLPVFNEIYDNAALYFNALDLEDMAEKLYILARDQQFHAQMQEKSLARAQYFTWEITAEKTLQVYTSLNKDVNSKVIPIEHEPIIED
jgi:glycosyltransferase involved in cell wall biosynthesis